MSTALDYHHAGLSPFFSSLGKKAAEHASYCPAVTNTTDIIQYSIENQKERITPFHLSKEICEGRVLSGCSCVMINLFVADLYYKILLLFYLFRKRMEN